MRIQIDGASKSPLYKQITDQIELAARDGRLAAGQLLPSMNELAAQLKISKETVKKSYGILADRGIIEPKQGKGFFVRDRSGQAHMQVLVIFDRLSLYKQMLLDAFQQQLGPEAEITILNHNQSVDLLQYYLDNHVGRFDWYVIAPHFPPDPQIRQRCIRQLRRIPFRKLILVDHLLEGLKGQFGAVYQDFENDIYDGLTEGLDANRRGTALRVITFPTSLYGSRIRKGIERFGADNGIPLEFLQKAPQQIRKGDTFLVLNSQLDGGLVELARQIRKQGLVIGEDVRIISYNEYEINELILGGLTSVSTDFKEMGRIAARMILSHELTKRRNPFHMTRRNSF